MQVYLHTFEYGTGKQSELEKYCKKIYYYKRSSVVKNIFSRIPYIVNSRKNMDLIKNLKSIKCPILFEGLHTTYPLWKDSFKDQKILIRTHNIEHKYYLGLAKSEKNISKKIFFYSEVWKLLNFEKILSKSNFPDSLIFARLYKQIFRLPIILFRTKYCLSHLSRPSWVAHRFIKLPSK